jgi:hypothetical protein
LTTIFEKRWAEKRRHRNMKKRHFNISIYIYFIYSQTEYFKNYNGQTLKTLIVPVKNDLFSRGSNNWRETQIGISIKLKKIKTASKELNLHTLESCPSFRRQEDSSEISTRSP